MRTLTMTAISLCLSTFAYAQDNRPATPVVVRGSEVTHVGRSPSEHVTLGVAIGTNDICPEKGAGWTGFIQRAQDGSNVTDFFTVPTGKALILTDFNFYAGKATAATWAPGDLLTVQMGRHGDFHTVWQTSVVLDAFGAATERAILQDHVISGTVFRSGQTPCARVGLGTEADGGALHVTLSVVHGYVVDEP